MTLVEPIHANAELVVNQFAPISGLGRGFGFNCDSVKWVAQFIESQCTKPDANKERVINVIGYYLGECLVQVYGCTWKNEGGQWSVYFGPRLSAHPFSKVSKQFKMDPMRATRFLVFLMLLPLLRTIPPS